MKRDKTIDNFRALAMLWVILVHVVYWTPFIKDANYRFFASFLLFEMPIFFFVTGASNSFSKKENYFSFVYKRYKRLLIPFWIFAIICAGTNIYNLYITEGITLDYSREVLISWLLPTNQHINKFPYLNYATWFIPVYLVIVLLIPILKKIKETKLKYIFIFILLGISIYINHLKLNWYQHIGIYTFWTYIGLFYSEISTFLQKNYRRLIPITLSVICIFILYTLHNNGVNIDIQTNKFPPSNIFTIFSISAVSLLLALTPVINGIFYIIYKLPLVGKMISHYNRHSMSIFLYQSFAFYFSVRWTKAIYPVTNSITDSIYQSLICLVITIPLCSLFAMAFRWTENLGNRKSK